MTFPRHSLTICHILDIPPGNQTWRAGKYTMHYVDFSIESLISSGFAAATFDDTELGKS